MTDIISVRAHAAILNGKAYRNCIVTYSPTDHQLQPSVIPFSTEVHSTTSFNGIILFAPIGFTIPTGLETPDDFTKAGSFTAYLNDLAEITPDCTAESAPVLLPL